jgi:adenylate kinase
VNLIIMGPPGAGKGTQAAPLGVRLDVPCISTGEILRDEVKRKTALGAEAKRSMDKGELVPDGVMISIIEDRLRRPDTAEGFILDGFPRTAPQAVALDGALASIERRVDKVISLAVPNDELVKRLSGRRTCRNCGALYHIIFDPPTNDMLCNRCNGDLFQRDDDHEDIITSRLEVYVRQTVPLLTYYRDRGVLLEIDGLGGRDDVTARILDGLGVPA